MIYKHKLSSQIEEYIKFKQGMGFLIKIESAELRRFASYARNINHLESVTSELALKWASENETNTRWYKARKLETVHTFSKYAIAIDPTAQLTPTNVFGRCHGRTIPYIYSQDEILLLMKESRNLYSPDGIRYKSISTALGLLWSTGLRVSELCNLTKDDINFSNGEILIRNTKFHKDRLIPIHITVLKELEEYSILRDKIYPINKCNNFFITTGGNALSDISLRYAFKLIRKILLPSDQEEWNRRAPRLYDLRHTFACNTILRWFREGVDVNHHILLLSVYLGHVKPTDTYWYLTGTPELLNLAMKKFEEYYVNSQNNGGIYEK